ncbi:MAG: hypothetical protein IPJ02_17800 [Chitinophagaceae bacterium]|nr:hypothetical protein [Chitinophagaceae bacterium]
MKENINKWCEIFSELLSIKEKHTVVFTSCLKRSDYFLPMIKIGSLEPFSKPAWFCEIWIDDKCIFRESRIPIDESNEQAEIKTIDKLMQSIFNHGVMGAKGILDKIEK